MFGSVFDGVGFFGGIVELPFVFGPNTVRARGSAQHYLVYPHIIALRPSTVIHLIAPINFQILVRSVGPKRASPTLVSFLLPVAGHGPLFGAVSGLFVLLLA